MPLVNVNLGDVLKPIDAVINHFFPDPAEQAKAREAIAAIQEHAADQQIAVDVAEAHSGSAFVAGWRPTVGYACAAALIITYLVAPFSKVLGLQMPAIDTGPLVQILLVMLGVDGVHGGIEKWRKSV